MSGFTAAAHTLPHALLRPFRSGEAAVLADGCAKIDPFHRLRYTPTTLAGYFEKADPALMRYAIEAEMEVAGIVAIRNPWLRGPFVEMLVVLPTWQGKGLGGEIVAWALAQASGDSLWATVSDFNGSARRFYKRQGFVEVAPLPGLVAAGETEILLRRRLKDAG